MTGRNDRDSKKIGSTVGDILKGNIRGVGGVRGEFQAKQIN